MGMGPRTANEVLNPNNKRRLMPFSLLPDSRPLYRSIEAGSRLECWIRQFFSQGNLTPHYRRASTGKRKQYPWSSSRKKTCLQFLLLSTVMLASKGPSPARLPSKLHSRQTPQSSLKVTQNSTNAIWRPAHVVLPDFIPAAINAALFLADKLLE